MYIWHWIVFTNHVDVHIRFQKYTYTFSWLYHVQLLLCWSVLKLTKFTLSCIGRCGHIKEQMTIAPEFIIGLCGFPNIKESERNKGRRQRERQTDRQTDRQTEGGAGRWRWREENQQLYYVNWYISIVDNYTFTAKNHLVKSSTTGFHTDVFMYLEYHIGWHLIAQSN